MHIKIIVARYNENIEWINPLKHYCIFINKGEPLNIENEFCIENVGRESHSYLWYIINNYENLPDIVAFIQGNIEDHIEMNNITYMQSIIKQAGVYGKSMPTAIHDYITNPSMNGELGPVWNYKNGNWYYPSHQYLNGHPMIFYDWFTQHVKPVYPNPMYFYMNGIFAVKKELILRNTKEFYINLIKQVDHNIGPGEGNFLERSWFHIFE